MPPKKKLTKKEKARLEAEQAEMLRIAMEKEKLKRLEESRQQRQVAREQAQRRLQLEMQESKQRRFQLKMSMRFFDKIRESTDAIKLAAKSQNDWEKYMRCNGLPNSSSPSELRNYIHQWRIDREQRNREERNWLLETNERTLLTQDKNVTDLTKAGLCKQQGNAGDVYAQRAKEVLGILLELNEVLDEKCKTKNILIDLDQLKTEIRILLKDYLEEFTHKIMSHIERDMEIDRPGVWRHSYESEVFKSFIWTFSKDAQTSVITKPRIGEQNEHNEIDFPLMEMQISLPPSVSLCNSALRGLWLNYDHFSDYCASFKIKKPTPDHMNILKQTKREWRKRKEILQNLLDKCSEEIPLTDLEQLEQPPELTLQPARDISADVDKLYLEHEDEMSILKRKAIGPEAFGLAATDVNLRKYRIIGGIYYIEYLEIPQQDKQLNARSFIRTSFAANKLVHKDYYQTFKPPPVPLPGVRRLPEEIEAEMRLVEAALDKLALVTVQLSDSVIWFEPPIACRWETETETLESDLREVVKQENNSVNGEVPKAALNIKPSRWRKRSSQKSTTSKLPVVEVNDFDMLRMPSDIDLYGLLRNFIVPRLPQGFTMHIDSSRLKQLQQLKSNRAKKKKQTIKLLPLVRHQQISSTFMPKVHKLDQEPQSSNPNLRIIETKRLTEDFLNFHEPKEFFPRIEYKKILKINKSGHDDCKLVLRKRDTQDTGKSLGKRGTSFEQENSSRRSSLINEEEETPRTYMFSQLIADLEHLSDLQTTVQQEELLQQISKNLMGKSNTATSILNGKEFPADNDKGVAKAEMLAPTSAAFSHHSGISFARESDENTDEHEEVDDETSTDTDTEYDNYDDYNDFCVNDYSDNETALKSYRSETSGCTSLGTATGAAHTPTRNGADKHNTLNKHGSGADKSASVGKNLKILNAENSFTAGKWSLRDVHDTKFNEDKLVIQFRAGRLGVFGFALNRYSNMPYQTWEIKPDVKCPDNIVFSFTASLVSLDMTITSQGFCVNNFQGGSTTAINQMLGKTLSLDNIKQILISSAVDIFPDDDAFCYTEGSCEKNYVMEMHLYGCMAALSLSHNFSWSRWNLLAGSRTAILLLRELVDGKKLPNYSTLLVTPLKAAIIDCSEVSPSFNTQGVEGMEYYADLFQLAQVHAQASSLEKQRNINPMLRDNVATILKAIRPLSFC